MSGNELQAPPAAMEDLQNWANEAGMETIPVLDAHDFAVWGAFEQDFQTPSIVHIGPDMRVLSFDEDIRDPAVFLGAE